MKSLRLAGVLLGLLLWSAGALRAWDYPGHRIVNELALKSLPADFPAFVQEPANTERIAFLAGEPDRWRNVPEAIMKQSGGSWTDHFLDAEQIPMAGLDFATLPSFRYDFVVAFAAGRAAHADKFPPIDPEKDTDHTREWPGFAPWAITEYYARLRSAFTYLKTFEELGTPAEVANAKANAIYVMGVMGHYVGDIAQPLHTTIHHNGWVGDNPHGYTLWPGFHSWIDGGFIAKAGVTAAEIAPTLTTAEPLSLAPRADNRDPVFVAVLDFLLAQNRLVEPLYQLEKEGKLGHGEQPITPEARAFIDGQLRKGGEMLGAIWLTAWRNAGPDDYLRKQLLKRHAAESAPR
ncbi:MAG TPA: hypothetical protein VHE13_11510 [Opitutus sp.]|nr:hypothetical protein [Opitutus sp.]